MVLVGPSGSGKSTALRIVAGLESPTSGDIWIGGRRSTAMRPRERNLAMVFQSYALYPHMDVSENLGFSLALSGLRRRSIAEKVGVVAANLGLGQLMGRKPRQLSGGQRQRVALGRAMVRQPDAFLMDEPLSNLDAQLRMKTRVDLARIHREVANTVLYVTHDQTEAMALGDRIVVLRNGRIQQVAPPSELFAHPRNAFVAQFIGSPPMNLLPLELTTGAQGAALVANGMTVEWPVERALRGKVASSRQLLLGVRPEHISRARETSGLQTFRGSVEVVEQLGFESLVHIRTGETLVAARFRGAESLRRGDECRFEFDIRNCHLFDERSGMNVEGEDESL